MPKYDKDSPETQENHIQKQIEQAHQNIKGSEFKIARMENELLLVLRELMNFNIYAPENMFDGDTVIKKDLDTSAIDELVPLNTFWIPIIGQEGGSDPDAKPFPVTLKPHYREIQ